MPSYIARVESNFKGGVDVELGPLTLVVGPSASKKTSIWNSIEWPFLGGCSDIGVYEWRSLPRDLMDGLAPPDAKKLWAKVTVNDGLNDFVCTAECTRNVKTGGTKKTVTELPVTATLPVHPFRDGLRGKPETIRAFLLTRMTGAVTAKDVKKQIPDGLQPHFDALWKAEQGANDEPIDLLLSVLTSAKSKAATLSKTAKAAKAASKEWAASLAPLPTDAQLQAADVAVTAAEEALKASQVPPTNADAPPSAADIQHLYNAALFKAQTFQKLEAHVQKLEGLVSGAPQADPATATTRSAFIRVMDMHLDTADISGCNICGAAFTAHTASTMKMTRDGLVNADLAAMTSINAQAQLKAARADLAIAQAHAETAVAAYAAAKKLVENAPKPVAVDYTAYYESVTELTSATTLRTQLTQLAKAWGDVQGKTIESNALEEEALIWGQLTQACTDAVTGLMDSARVAFVKRVNTYLPKDSVFDLVLYEERGGKTVDTCKFGLVRDGHLQWALSGAELGRVVAAMTAAAIPDKAVDGAGPIVVTLPKDVGMDRTTLRATMTALAPLQKRGVQVILFSVVTHAGKKPAGWTIVNVDPAGVCSTTFPKGQEPTPIVLDNTAGAPA
jgi:hypothetical protein